MIIILSSEIIDIILYSIITKFKYIDINRVSGYLLFSTSSIISRNSSSILLISGNTSKLFIKLIRSSNSYNYKLIILILGSITTESNISWYILLNTIILLSIIGSNTIVIYNILDSNNSSKSSVESKFLFISNSSTI